MPSISVSRQAGIGPGELDFVAFYDKPLAKFDRLLETYIGYAPVGFASFESALPVWLREKLHLPRQIHDGLNGEFCGRIHLHGSPRIPRCQCFLPVSIHEAAILTVDGVGEWATATYGIGRGNRIELTHELRFPHSLGLFYSAFTYFTGFKVNSGEYKLMGLAPYGVPRFKTQILEHLIDLKADGSFRMDMSYFNYCQGLTMTGPKFDELFGGPPRRPEAPLTQREMDIAASIQAVTDEIMVRMAQSCGTRIGHEESGHGRRRRAQLRGKRADSATGHFRSRMDSACGGRRGRLARRGIVRVASDPRSSRGLADGVHDAREGPARSRFWRRADQERPRSSRSQLPAI